MPCQSDYMNPSGQELESQRVCIGIVYLYERLKRVVPEWITKAANDYYGNVSRLDEATKILCETCRSLTESEAEEFIYDAHSADARNLVSWWERHQEWDARRVKEEEKARARVVAKERALRKLTVEEIDALGL